MLTVADQFRENFVIIGLNETRFAILTLAPHFIDTGCQNSKSRLEGVL
jgi:hypothetical protein